jgi:hypothetical protein
VTTAVATTVAPASSATTTPALTTTATPSQSSGTCAEAWEQCGGQGWQGSTCCASGLTCAELNEWFSMCEPSSLVEEAGTTTAASATAAPAATTTTAPTTTAVTSTAAPATTADGAACAGPWEQCGGNGWTGATCCVSGYACNELSEWHSQCDPSRRLRR